MFDRVKERMDALCSDELSLQIARAALTAPHAVDPATGQKCVDAVAIQLAEEELILKMHENTSKILEDLEKSKNWMFNADIRTEDSVHLLLHCCHSQSN